MVRGFLGLLGSFSLWGGLLVHCVGVVGVVQVENPMRCPPWRQWCRLIMRRPQWIGGGRQQDSGGGGGVCDGGQRGFHHRRDTRAGEPRGIQSADIQSGVYIDGDANRQRI